VGTILIHSVLVHSLQDVQGGAQSACCI